MSAIAASLEKATGLSQNKDEGEQEYLTRLAEAVQELDEDAFGELDEAAQEWFNNACLAAQKAQPLQPFPDAAGDAGKKKEPEAPPVRGRRSTKGADKTPAAAEKETGKTDPGKKPGSGKKGASKAEDPPAAKGKAGAAANKKEAGKVDPTKGVAAARKNPTRKRAAGTGIGALGRLLEEFHKDPKLSIDDLITATKKAYPGEEVKEANAIGIRQQYRRIITFLQGKGLLKEIDLGG